MTERRDWEDALPEIIAETQQHEVDLLVRCLEIIAVRKNNDTIAEALMLRLRELGLHRDPQYLEAHAGILSQKPPTSVAA